MAISPENGVAKSIQRAINRATESRHIIFKLPTKPGVQGTIQKVVAKTKTPVDTAAKSAAELAGRITAQK